ncbi:NBR1-Ig-like domain-containing protein [Saccharopolyspora griseoalba]|uniref:NBR1-Ig-like domain-containing protein n=1 Tax=Saccharopolyspora griseoalba TaxID=1431848 RepID=A0ABW2LKS1_9PSEU
MPRSQRAERPPALEEFVVALRALRERAGEPSFRRMAAKSGAVSHATLHLTVTGYRLQPWQTVREFVRACDGDEDEWCARWRRAAQELAGAPGPGEPVDAAPGQLDGAEPVAEVAALEPAVEPRGSDEVEAEAGAPHRWWRSHWFLVLSVLTVLGVLGAAVPMFAGAPVDERVVHPGDASDFLRDVTYPDGAVVPADAQFIKVWELRNVGSVHWRDRYLQRVDVSMGSEGCRTSERIPIPATAPGQEVQIPVTVRTPPRGQVDCKVRWKMVDESGRELMPGYRPIYFEVRVR